ncbi:MAG: thiamine phosphate synthase [Gemmatimonadota bacterium]|nr:thiamine phosphate synthase [Gemmatimonadota bacterium]
MFDPRTLTLLAITDDLRDGVEGLVGRATAAVRGGATMVQLRLKDANARTLVEVARALVAELTVPVVVNDRADVALTAGAAGVHLGIDDLPVAAVRGIAPQGFIIGASVGNDAELPAARGADYVGIGPVYGTLSKSDAGAPIGVAEFARLARECGMPAVAIGGVTADSAAPLIAAGASGIAVIRAVMGALDPEAAARTFGSATGR